ncbi:MAG: phage adsorption protein NrfB [Candidatus Eremiobacteraeota bacterium]|nr:phage adsorption protein NrfB [Candidatus Eremiobacteraeota bacterium]
MAHALSSMCDEVVVGTAIAFALFGIDDLIFDVAYWVRLLVKAVSGKRFPPLTLERLLAKPQQRIAIFVPCWHEDTVVDKMVELACRTIQYDRYDIFIGAYPNDPATLQKARAIARRNPRVRVVVNSRNGPTTKAQNLNEMYEEMVRVEGSDRYDVVVLHDVEDVIHPYSLLVYNLLVPRRDMVQLPVFPLERSWQKWTAWTYADDFAENHLKDLVVRERFGSFVPCAGVGCAFNRAAIEALGEQRGELFPSESLTEDYQLGLRLREQGFSTIVVHQRLSGSAQRAASTRAAAYVATREYFPDTFATAVRQRTRWIAGISFQAWRDAGWAGSWFTRYTLYRDRKGILSNLFVFAGYAGFAGSAAIAAWAAVDHHIVPVAIGEAWQWDVLHFVIGITAVRLLQKCYFVGRLYGPLHGLLSVLRVPWGALINGVATARAAMQVVRSMATGRAIRWAKTQHAFPTVEGLEEFRLRLGEVLIDGGLANAAEVEAAMTQRREGERIGETLVRLGLVTARGLATAIAAQIGADDGRGDDLVPGSDVADRCTLEDARRWSMLPLGFEDDRLRVAVDGAPSDEAEIALRTMTQGSDYRLVVVEHRRLLAAIERSFTYADGDDRRKPIGRYLVDRGLLAREQLEELLAEQEHRALPLLQLAHELGMLDDATVASVSAAYFSAPPVPAIHGEIVPPSFDPLPASAT